MEHLFGFCIESYLYVFAVGIFQIVPFVAFVALFAVPLWFIKGGSKYMAFMLRFIGFNLLFLAWGCVGNYAWVTLARDHLYTSCDPIIDWLPYAAFSSKVYDYQCAPEEHGHLLGNATDAQLFQLWLLLAVTTWVLSLFSFLLLCRYSRYLRAAWNFMMDDQ